MTTPKAKSPKAKKPRKTGPRVDLGEGVALGIHAAPQVIALVRTTKAAAADGLTREEAWDIVTGDFRALFDGVWDDVVKALED